ncbi:hypothetical protein [Pseudomonas shahriarae]|uniref:hypothetical protein n=1 Tax=Pseudomonas shahriarae TaxID=2745512 RepID=UPI00235E32A6|nr:hypothetical protein [Pseudomonas shahriarae]MDD1131156.1 hypothetical protein [Pseudomonas shahriarae]
MTKLFNLPPEEISQLLRFYWFILKSNKKTDPDKIIANKVHIESLVARQLSCKNLPDEDLKEIVWFIAGSTDLLKTLKKRRLLTPMIADIHREVRVAYPDNLYDPATASGVDILIFK